MKIKKLFLDLALMRLKTEREREGADREKSELIGVLIEFKFKNNSKRQKLFLKNPKTITAYIFNFLSQSACVYMREKLFTFLFHFFFCTQNKILRTMPLKKLDLAIRLIIISRSRMSHHIFLRVGDN